MEKFKKYIQTKNKEDLKSELEELYSSFENVREHYSIKLNTLKINSGIPLNKEKPDPKIIEKYQRKIQTALFPNENFKGGFDIDKIENILSRLKRRPNIKYYIEIGCFATEESTELSNLYGGDYGEEYYIFFAELYEKICWEVLKFNLTNEYVQWLREIKYKAFEGYDFRYELEEIFNENFK